MAPSLEAFMAINGMQHDIHSTNVNMIKQN